MDETAAFLSDPDLTLYCGDAREVLATLPERSVHAALCSPPFFSLRDYGVEGQIGLEDSPEEWAEALVAVFREVRRVLRDDASLWVECGDSYASYSGGGNSAEPRADGTHGAFNVTGSSLRAKSASGATRKPPVSLKQKDLIGQPFLLAFALRADGWYWRGMYVWEKPDAMPESATDRCTTAHSYVMHFSKAARYFHDGDAIREAFAAGTTERYAQGCSDQWRRAQVASVTDARVNGYLGGTATRLLGTATASTQLNLDGDDAEPERRGADGRRVTTVVATHNSEQHRDGERWPSPQGRNARSVWRITTEATSFGLCPICRCYWDSGAPAEHCGVRTVAHFATWPHALAGKIIACATSEAGCCEACGAPRVRVSERTVENPGNRSNNGQRGRSIERRGFDVRREISAETLGFAPSCACDAPTVPCTVLDPFAGSATTGRQARAMGRRAILIELSPDYAEIADHRLRQLSLA